LKIPEDSGESGGIFGIPEGTEKSGAFQTLVWSWVYFNPSKQVIDAFQFQMLNFLAKIIPIYKASQRK